MTPDDPLLERLSELASDIARIADALPATRAAERLSQALLDAVIAPVAPVARRNIDGNMHDLDDTLTALHTVAVLLGIAERCGMLDPVVAHTARAECSGLADGLSSDRGRSAPAGASAGSAGHASAPPGPAVVYAHAAPEPVGVYPHARRVGNLLFLSGVGPRERGTPVIPGVVLDAEGRVESYDIEAQCRSVFRNVRSILSEAGSDWERLVDVTVFLTDMARDFDTYNRLYEEYFPDNRPCRTTVEVRALPTPIAIELKCIATIGG